MTIDALIKRDFILAWRQRGHSASRLVFMLLVVTLFPFALTTAPDILSRFAPGLLILAVLFSLFTHDQGAMNQDLEDGTLDMIISCQLSLPLYALCGCLCAWLTQLIPLLLLLPAFMMLLQVDIQSLPNFILTLSLGTLILHGLLHMGSALIIGARKGKSLLPLLLLPFYIPVLIFMVDLAQHGLNDSGLQAFFFLSAQAILYITLVPFLSAHALRAASESA
jgi:heme exporter protein B